MEELLKRIKSITRKASILEQDNFKLIEANLIEHKANDLLSKQCNKTLAKQEELVEMIEALIDELEGTTKTDHTFRLIREAKDLIYY